MRARFFAVSLAAVLLLGPAAAHADVSFGAIGPNQKVRPGDAPQVAASISLKAARNEFEPFQLVLLGDGSATTGVSVALTAPLTGPGGVTIPAENVVLYRQDYYNLSVPSNLEGASGRWPDPLIPDVDSYFGEQRNAFPFDVPAGEARAVWVDVLVPPDAVPGDYAAALEVRVDGQAVGTVPFSLRVGNFSLPSTASLESAFGMGWSAPCIAHTGYTSCTPDWQEEAANKLRALYLRAGLEHRFTVSDVIFQPPFGGSAAPFEAHVLPYILGTGTSRLNGARLTSVRLDGGDGQLAAWISYARDKGFFDRLFYYPVDEPHDVSAWETFLASAQALQQADPEARIILTTDIQSADQSGVTDAIDIFCPVINYLHDKPGSTYEGNQRPAYDGWLAGQPGRKLWAYQSCMSHGCGDCGTPSESNWFDGWPERVIDSSAVQDRCFPWLAHSYRITGELYFATSYQLPTAWDTDGQCAFSGHGDGTLFYPGIPSLIGGTTDIPIESVRMKLIREGMEDYEYLHLAAQLDPAGADSIAAGLFPNAYSCAQSPEAVQAARDQLFAMLDESAPDGGVTDSGNPSEGGSPEDASVSDDGSAADSNPGGGDGSTADSSTAAGANPASPAVDEGCGCRTVDSGPGDRAFLSVLGLLAVVWRLRRRR